MRVYEHDILEEFKMKFEDLKYKLAKFNFNEINYELLHEEYFKKAKLKINFKFLEYEYFNIFNNINEFMKLKNSLIIKDIFKNVLEN